MNEEDKWEEVTDPKLIEYLERTKSGNKLYTKNIYSDEILKYNDNI